MDERHLIDLGRSHQVHTSKTHEQNSPTRSWTQFHCSWSIWPCALSSKLPEDVDKRHQGEDLPSDVFIAAHSHTQGSYRSIDVRHISSSHDGSLSCTLPHSARSCEQCLNTPRCRSIPSDYPRNFTADFSATLPSSLTASFSTISPSSSTNQVPFFFGVLFEVLFGVLFVLLPGPGVMEVHLNLPSL